MCLRSIVDEIVLQKNNQSIKKPSDRHKLKETPFLTRNKMLISQQSSVRDYREGDDTMQRDNEAKKKDLAEDDEFITNDDL